MAIAAWQSAQTVSFCLVQLPPPGSAIWPHPYRMLESLPDEFVYFETIASDLEKRPGSVAGVAMAPPKDK